MRFKEKKKRGVLGRGREGKGVRKGKGRDKHTNRPELTGGQFKVIILGVHKARDVEGAKILMINLTLRESQKASEILWTHMLKEDNKAWPPSWYMSGVYD